jgi:ketosteroid isomerase-like protein
MSNAADANVARKLYAALRSGDVESLRELLDLDIHWHVPGAHPRSGDYDGRDEVVPLLSRRHGRHDASFTVLDVLAGDQFVMVFVEGNSELDGQTLQSRFVHVMTTRDGRVTESWHFDENQTQLDAFLNRQRS